MYLNQNYTTGAWGRAADGGITAATAGGVKVSYEISKLKKGYKDKMHSNLNSIYKWIIEVEKEKMRLAGSR